MRFIYPFISLLALGIQSLGAVTPDPGEALYPNIVKKTDDLYVAQMPDHDLRLVMERVNDRNVGRWRSYAGIQSHEEVIRHFNGHVDKNQQQLSLQEGSGHFCSVLRRVSCSENEIWIAYVSEEKNPEGIPTDFYYSVRNATHPTTGSFPSSIKMFVTVTSNPNALLTSHMGIAASVEGALGQRPRGISVDLHSFGAKVMRMRNPDRRFMINAPAFAMEKILIDKLPAGSLFIGTREMRQVLQERASMDFNAFLASEEGLSNQADVHEFINSDIENELNRQRELQKYVAHCVKEGKTHKEAEALFLHTKKLEFVDIVDGKLVRSEARIKNGIEDSLLIDFKSFKNRYAYPKIDNLENGFLSLMEKYPPLLSVDEEMGRHFENRLTIFDPKSPDDVWMTVDESNRQTYDWLFQEPFKPAGKTHYIVVDLETLANAKPVERPSME